MREPRTFVNRAFPIVMRSLIVRTVTLTSCVMSYLLGLGPPLDSVFPRSVDGSVHQLSPLKTPLGVLFPSVPSGHHSQTGQEPIQMGLRKQGQCRDENHNRDPTIAILCLGQ